MNEAEVIEKIRSSVEEQLNSIAAGLPATPMLLENCEAFIASGLLRRGYEMVSCDLEVIDGIPGERDPVVSANVKARKIAPVEISFTIEDPYRE